MNDGVFNVLSRLVLTYRSYSGNILVQDAGLPARSLNALDSTSFSRRYLHVVGLQLNK